MRALRISLSTGACAVFKTLVAAQRPWMSRSVLCPAWLQALAYYIALKVPEGLQRLDVLKQQYDEAWDRAAGEDQEKAAVRFVPRQQFIGSGT
jgi:hypothetical protein